MNIETQLNIKQIRKATTMLTSLMYLKKKEKYLDLVLSNFGKAKNTFSLD